MQVREYNYDVGLKGFGYAFLIGNILTSWRIFVNKRMVWWPLITAPVHYLWISPMYFLLTLVYCRSIARRYLICAISDRSSIWVSSVMRYFASAIASLIGRTFETSDRLSIHSQQHSIQLYTSIKPSKHELAYINVCLSCICFCLRGRDDPFLPRGEGKFQGYGDSGQGLAISVPLLNGMKFYMFLCRLPRVVALECIWFSPKQRWFLSILTQNYIWCCCHFWGNIPNHRVYTCDGLYWNLVPPSVKVLLVVCCCCTGGNWWSEWRLFVVLLIVNVSFRIGGGLIVSLGISIWFVDVMSRLWWIFVDDWVLCETFHEGYESC